MGRAVQLWALVTAVAAVGSTPSCENGECPASVMGLPSSSMLQVKARTERAGVEAGSRWNVEGTDDIEGQLSTLEQELPAGTTEHEKAVLSRTLPGDKRNDVQDAFGKDLLNGKGIAAAIWRGCVEYVDMVCKDDYVADYAVKIDDFVAKCKTGIFSEKQAEPVKLDGDRLSEECDRVGKQLTLQHRILGPSAFDTPRRFCTVLVEYIIPIESEPACMHFTEDLSHLHMTLVGRAAPAPWPAIINEPLFEEAFLQTCQIDSDSAGEGCSDKLVSVQALSEKKYHHYAELFADLCPALQLEMPKADEEGPDPTTHRTALLSVFHHASRIAEARSNASGSLMTRRATAKSKFGARKIMDQSTAAKGPPRRRRLSTKESRCCDEQAYTSEGSVEISAAVAIGGTFEGWGYGFDSWDGNTCIYKQGNFRSYCEGAGADVGGDVRYIRGYYHRFSNIHGCAKMVSAGAALIIAFGGGVIMDCQLRNQIGHQWEFGIGLGVEVAFAQCTAGSYGTDHTTRYNNLKQRCPAKSCFPQGAQVQTPSGVKLMQELRVGDKVLASDNDGQLVFDDVYFFGHADHDVVRPYVEFHVQAVGQEGSATTLHISPDHYMLTCPLSKPCTWAERTSMYARKLEAGDFVWVSERGPRDVGAFMSLASITQKDLVAVSGAYNPYTLSGTIVVDGVISSAHSSWVLDDWTPEWLSHLLPTVYQKLFLPGRLLYSFAGSSAADWLDVNNPQTSPDSFGKGPHFLGLTALVLMAFSASALRFARRLARRTGASKR